MVAELVNPGVQAVAAKLMENQQTIAIAESATGGLISASLLAVPGASNYFVGGSVVYTLASRKTVLGIARDAVADLAPMSEAMAMAFAERAREQLGTTWGMAELGIAGPGGPVYGHPPGTCVIAVAGPNPVSTQLSTGHDNREENMWAFAQGAMTLLANALQCTPEYDVP